LGKVKRLGISNRVESSILTEGRNGVEKGLEKVTEESISINTTKSPRSDDLLPRKLKVSFLEQD
jgi:hypothetical protein